MRLGLTLGFVMAAAPALAQVDLKFIEGAPKDRFVLTNQSDCLLDGQDLVLDLRATTGKLIFDVTSAGAGVEVFQPLEMTSGADKLSAVPSVMDGDQTIAFNLAGFGPGDAIAFTIDVDDTLGAREITVTGSEMDGAVLTLDGATVGAFGAPLDAPIACG